MLFYNIYTNLFFREILILYIRYFMDIIFTVYILAKIRHLVNYSIHVGWIPLRKGRYIHPVYIHSGLNPKPSLNMHFTRHFI